jgi:hypothetical protein
MLKRGQLIAVNGNLYEYDRYDKHLNVHFCTEVEIDEDGTLTATYVPCGFTDEELSNRGINLTQEQWIGLTEHFIRQEYVLDEEEIKEAAEDIVCRCFTVTRIPLVEELPNYIAHYMDR